VQVKRNVVVKGIVTPWLKEDLKSKANALIKQTEIEMQTLERQLRQLSVMVPGQTMLKEPRTSATSDGIER